MKSIKNDFLQFAAEELHTTRLHVEHQLNRTHTGLQNFTPAVIEERQLNVAQMDVFSRLMMDRIIFLGRPVDDYVANVIQAQLLFLDSTDNKRDIQLYINSPGGSVTAGLGIYDTMQFINAEVATICTSMAASMASVLLCAGQPRQALCPTPQPGHDPSAVRRYAGAVFGHGDHL